MGLFGRFFDKRSGGDSNGRALGYARSVEVQSLGSRLLRLPALDHFGPYSRSSNGRYTLVWRDGNGSHDGARESGEGRYVLLDGNRLVVDGRMERPNDGKIADNGTFVLNGIVRSAFSYSAFRGGLPPVAPLRLYRSTSVPSNSIRAS